MSNKLVLIDGNSLLFRAFYALPLLHNEKGVYTNALYGFTNILLNILEEEQPTNMLVAFDAGKTTFRRFIYYNYFIMIMYYFRLRFMVILDFYPVSLNIKHHIHCSSHLSIKSQSCVLLHINVILCIVRILRLYYLNNFFFFARCSILFL